VRTLQTIQPYCLKEHRKVNVEWSLVEAIPQETTYPKEFAAIVNADYESFLNIRDADIIIDDVFEGLKEQVGPFIDSLDKDKNILLVTHMPVINAILSYRGNTEVTMFTHHYPGSLTVLENK
jgi:broad specificity phosphatase PhoE